MKLQYLLGKDVRPYNGSSPTVVVDVKISQQNMEGRGIGEGSRNMGKAFVSVNRKRLIKGHVLSRCGAKISNAVLVVNHVIFDTNDTASQAYIAILGTRKGGMIAA